MGLRIRNTENVQDKLVDISFRHRDQLKHDVVWGVLGMVVQKNSRLGLSDRLEVHLDIVRMSASNSREKTKRRSLGVMSAIKEYCCCQGRVVLAFALIIAMAEVNGDTKYASYTKNKGLKKTC